ncbi:hypothetical protein [Brevibacillus laterosporus]|nr:hypothetical protein [Brevibacillus laterosporus]
MQQQDLLRMMKKPVLHGAMSKIANGTIPKLETAADMAKALNVHIDGYLVPGMKIFYSDKQYIFQTGTDTVPSRLRSWCKGGSFIYEWKNFIYQ